MASSKTRNLASNLWFDPILRFNQSDCDGHKDPLPDYDSLAKYEFNPEPLSDELYLDNAKLVHFLPSTCFHVMVASNLTELIFTLIFKKLKAQFQW